MVSLRVIMLNVQDGARIAGLVRVVEDKENSCH